MRQAVILCGGRGTRLGELTRDIPKPLLPVGGEVLLDKTIALLERDGIARVLLIAGHLGEQIEERYKGGTLGGVEITVFRELEALGTAGGLVLAQDLLEDSFLLVYGDIFVDLNFARLREEHLSRAAEGAVATLLVRPSDHPWDSHLVDFNEQGWVNEFVFQQEEGRLYRNWGNVAIYGCEKTIVDFIPRGQSSDFGRDVFPAILKSGGKIGVCELEVGAFVRDMGTPDRLAVVEEYLERKRQALEAKEQPLKPRVLLLDRDGTLNVEKGHLGRAEDLELLPGVGETLCKFKQAGWKCHVITNQPGIARGEFSQEDLDAIHMRLRELIAEEGGEIGDIFYSPFHPETHHGDGVKALRRASDCRKPNPEMLFKAAEECGFSLGEAVMVGDTWRDIVAGNLAGVRTVFVGEPGTTDHGTLATPTWSASTLEEVFEILQQA